MTSLTGARHLLKIQDAVSPIPERMAVDLAVDVPGGKKPYQPFFWVLTEIPIGMAVIQHNFW
jgi:hypothetical protein